MDLMNITSDSPCVETKACYMDTLTGNLQRRKQRAETELAQVNAALEALQKNPEIASVLELVSKVGR